jgi:hypothetical protein
LPAGKKRIKTCVCYHKYEEIIFLVFLLPPSKALDVISSDDENPSDADKQAVYR